ncbi:hypothetical protein HN803_05770 [candidate division WWE3 bacterium]|jgi:hypothetical protein|nr:hypothetical protein [candidate division WWE3 bacterium]MBT7350265.1 hypothetical protein [candidate division WWE3 bacterium]
MNNRERVIYIYLTLFLKGAGIEKEMSKKWLKATSAMLYFAINNGFDAFFKVWLLAIELMPEPEVEIFDKDVVLEEEPLRLLYAGFENNDF